MLALAAPASAQDPASPLAAFEMAGHRALAAVRQDAPLAPFTTDGCSGGLSTTWRTLAETVPEFAASLGTEPPWEACCVTHDRAYHDAGPDPDPEASFAARLAADDALMACVQRVGEQEIAARAAASDLSTAPETLRSRYRLVSIALYQAVRAGGKPCSGLPWRWGYGYPGCLIGPSDFLSAD
jgi:hypothetical protein